MGAIISFTMLLLVLLAFKWAGKHGKSKERTREQTGHETQKETQKNMEEYERNARLASEHLISETRKTIESRKNLALTKARKIAETQNDILDFFEKKYNELEQKPGDYMRINFPPGFMYVLPPEEGKPTMAIDSIVLDVVPELYTEFGEEEQKEPLTFTLVKFPYTHEDEENLDNVDRLPVHELPGAAAALAGFLKEHPDFIKIDFQ